MEGDCGGKAGWEVPGEDEAIGATGNESARVVTEPDHVDGEIMTTEQRQQFAGRDVPNRDLEKGVA